MAARDLRYVVLGEDRSHLNFVRRWLIAEGVERRQIFERETAASLIGGSGEQFVRQQYVAEVGYYRAKANHQRVALIVVIDADLETVEYRKRQLDEVLGDEPRRPSERIAVVVPRRNIETWLTVLLDPAVVDEGEATDFKPRCQRPTSEAYANAGACFAEFLRREPHESDRPSLAAARPEAARLK